MATRSRIGVLNEDGTVTSVYSHWDGYPEHHLPILLEAFGSEETARDLVSLGDLSILGHELGVRHDFDAHDPSSDVCLFYGRDRGEQGTRAVTHEDDAWPDSGQEYQYLFYPDGWRVYEA